MNKAVTVALLLGASLAVAGPKLAVIDLSSPPTMMGLAAQVTQSLLTHAQEQGYALVLPDEVREKLGANAYDELRACGGKLACANSWLNGVKADRVVLGSLTRNERNYVLNLWLIDLKELEVVAEVDRSILIASRRLSHEIEEAIPRLLKGQSEARGTLELTCNVRGVEVTLDGRPMGLTPLKVELKPGKHEVKLEKYKYLEVTRLVAVEAGQVTKEEVRLLLMPGEQSDEDGPLVTEGSTILEEKGGKVLPWLKWVAGGISVAAAGTGLFLGWHARSLEDSLVAGYDPATDVYTGTRSQALEARQSALAANVLFGVAAGAAVAGVGLALFLPSGDQAKAVSVAPVAAPGGAGVLLKGSF